LSQPPAKPAIYDAAAHQGGEDNATRSPVPRGALSRHGRAFPLISRNRASDLKQTLGNAANAQNTVDTVAAEARQQLLDFQQGAARHFLKAEPMQAVQSALNGKNPVGDLQALSKLVAIDPDAKAGLQRAVADYLTQRVVRAPVRGAENGVMNPAALNAVLKREMALRQVFSADQVKALRDLSADLQRASMPLPKGAESTAPSGPIAGKLSLVSGYLGHGIAGLAGYLLGGFHGAVEGTGGYTMGKAALDAMRRSGIERTDQLLTEALLNPELARALLMKASPGNRPFIAQRLASQLGTLAAVSGAEAANQNRATKPGQVGSVSARRSVASMPPPYSGALVSGGAFRRAVGQ
jgi:hypothetical protein